MNDLMTIAAPAEFASPSVETAATAVATQAKALVEARYIMAMRRPRDMDAVRERMLKECRRPSFAAVARYAKPIGKDKSKWPTGPSIRFAEAAVRNMTNITVETMTVFDSREQRIVRVTVTDLEANVPYSQDVTITKTIERRAKKEGDVVLRERTNSYGDKLYILEATDDDIINKQAALISKAVRTLGLRLIPGDIVDECMEIIVETQGRADAQDPDAAKRKLFDAFAGIGVRAEQIKEYLGNDAGTLSPKELQDLRALFAAIRDGEASWRDVMDAKEGRVKEAASADAVRTVLADKKAEKNGARKQDDQPSADHETRKEPVAVAQTAEQTAPPPSSAGAATDAGSTPAGDGDAIEQLAADWTAAIDSAESGEELGDLALRAEKALRAAPEPVKARIAKVIENRGKALAKGRK